MGEPVIERMRRVGRDLYVTGLVSTRSGNLSVRVRETIVITRTGALLGHLGPSDLVEVPVDTADDRDAEASSDLIVHREVYRRSDALAIVHAHAPETIALSLRQDSIVPADTEGQAFIPNVPVFEETRPRTGVSAAIGDAIASGVRIAAVRAHGTFAAGDAIEAAAHWTTCLAMSSRILLAGR
jgi:L-fuculose-phosphate aldolase